MIITLRLPAYACAVFMFSGFFFGVKTDNDTFINEAETNVSRGAGNENNFGKQCKSEPNYIYPNPKNCSTFYKCWGGKLYPIECPEPLVFNTELLVCDWTWNVTTCDPENIPDTDYGLG